MTADLRSRRRWVAIAVWLCGILAFAGLAWWNIADSRRDAENRLITEAGRTAAQFASLLSLPEWALDDAAARAAVEGAMEDERIYAVHVDYTDGFSYGLRRNYLWEPVAWDGDLAENCVQGMTPLKMGSRVIGQVAVWLSPRLNNEEEALLLQREILRFVCFFCFWTLALFLCFWQWGDLRRLKRAWLARKEPLADVQPGHAPVPGPEAEQDKARIQVLCAVDPEQGRKYQRSNPDAWLVTAGMFRQTFVRGPELLNRLYSDGEMAGLCHLGRLLEQAAPCVGADKLADAARQMQTALNDPDCQTRAAPVENCVKCLEEVLDALCGEGQWRSKNSSRGAG